MGLKAPAGQSHLTLLSAPASTDKCCVTLAKKCNLSELCVFHDLKAGVGVRWVHTYGELRTSFIDCLLYTCCSVRARASVTLFRVTPSAVLAYSQARELWGEHFSARVFSQSIGSPDICQ